jgi:hypothetical protein
MKSNIMGAMKLGLNPADFESESALRKATKDLRAEQSPELTVRAQMKASITELKTSEDGDATLATLLAGIAQLETANADRIASALLSAFDKAILCESKATVIRMKQEA